MAQVLVPVLSSYRVDQLDAFTGAACPPYWRHELAPLPPRPQGTAVLLAKVACSLEASDVRPVVVYYAPDRREPPGQILVDRTFTRGRWLRRERRLLAVECATAEAVTALLARMWNASGNDSLIVVVGVQRDALDYIRQKYVDDVEANPVNEEGILSACTAALSRGWDGADARIYSRTIGPREAEEALAAACKD